MAGCCSGAGGCRCNVTFEEDDGCNPVQITISGAGSAAAPFVIGSTFDVTRVVRLEGNEYWAVDDVAGCDVLVPRGQYELRSSSVMCHSGTGAFVGYTLVILDIVAGTEVLRWQAVDSTTLQTSLPANWAFCCPQLTGEFHSMCTAAGDPDDPDTLVGYVTIRYDIETGTYQQQYITLAGSITTTIPGSWIPCGCGASELGDPTEITLTENYIVADVALMIPDAANMTLTDMAAAEDFLNATVRYATKIDLTDWTEARLVVRKMGTAGAANSEIAVEYSTVNPGSAFVGGDWLPLGTSDIECAINTTNTTIASSWVAIATLARADVHVAPLMRGGDGALDPIIGAVHLQLRRQVVTDATVTGGGGGGGGGAGVTAGAFALRVPAGGVLDDVRYPDHGIPDLADADRVAVMRIPSTLTTGTWDRLAVTLYNVTAAPTANIVVVLKNITDVVDVGTVTITSGTSPTSNMIITETSISGTFTDEEVLQWHISNAPDDNAFGLYADAFYELT